VGMSGATLKGAAEGFAAKLDRATGGDRLAGGKQLAIRSALRCCVVAAH
jgi:hypothetical protein